MNPSHYHLIRHIEENHMTHKDTKMIENVNQPGKTYNVNAVKYNAMRECMLQLVPTEPPGISAQELYDALVPALPQEIWPNGEKVSWWQKTVQLDLEAKAILCRYPKSKPLRWWQPRTA
jgi:hypothetical protein